MLITTDCLQSNCPQFVVFHQLMLPQILRHELNKPRRLVILLIVNLPANGKQHSCPEHQESANQTDLHTKQTPQKQAFVQLVAN